MANEKDTLTKVEPEGLNEDTNNDGELNEKGLDAVSGGVKNTPAPKKYSYLTLDGIKGESTEKEAGRGGQDMKAANDRLSEYEKQLNESIADQPMIVFCTYPLSASGAVMRRIQSLPLRRHAIAAIAGLSVCTVASIGLALPAPPARVHPRSAVSPAPRIRHGN